MLKARIIDYTLNACDTFHKPVYCLTLRLGRKITFNVNARFHYLPLNFKLSSEDLSFCIEILEVIVDADSRAELLREVTQLVTPDCYYYHKFAQLIDHKNNIAYFYFATVRPLI